MGWLTIHIPSGISHAFYSFVKTVHGFHNVEKQKFISPFSTCKLLLNGLSETILFLKYKLERKGVLILFPISNTVILTGKKKERERKGHNSVR